MKDILHKTEAKYSCLIFLDENMGRVQNFLKIYFLCICISSSTGSSHLFMHKDNFYESVIKQVQF